MREIEDIAEEWIKVWSDGKIPAVGDGVSESILDWELPREQPEKCFDIILVVLEKIKHQTDNRLLSILAAGPLEDLLHENGGKVVDRVEINARKNPLFRKLLNGVWDSEVKESVKSQLSKYMDERW